MICPNCKQNNSDDSKFCKSCGATLPQPKVYYCKACGRRLAPEARFCPSCGERKPLRTEQAQPQRPTSSTSTQNNSQKVHIVERPTNYGNQHYDNQPPKQEKKQEKEQSKGCGCLFHLIFFFVVAIAAAGYYYMQLLKKERMAYEKVKSTMNIAQMEEYLSTDFYVFNDHKDDIRDRIERIRTDNVDFRSATSVASCERYLDRHPEGRYRKEVEKRLEKLKNKASSEEVVEDIRDFTRQPVTPKPSMPASNSPAAEEPTAGEAAEAETETGGTKYYIQVGYRNKREDADASAKRNAEKGFGHVVVKKDDKATRNYITSGAYNSKEEAERHLENARKQYPDATIISE